MKYTQNSPHAVTASTAIMAQVGALLGEGKDRRDRARIVDRSRAGGLGLDLHVDEAQRKELRDSGGASKKHSFSLPACVRNLSCHRQTEAATVPVPVYSLSSNKTCAMKQAVAGACPQINHL